LHLESKWLRYQAHIAKRIPLVLRHFTFEHGANILLEYRSNVALHVLVQHMFGLARELE
jgi:hypothetical protein